MIPASLDLTAHPDRNGWSGPDATDGAAGGAVASAAFRPRSPVAVPGTARPSKEQGRAGRSNAETGAILFPVPAPPIFRARLPSVIQYLPLQLALPTGFDSWAQVLTDWRVSRAFEASPFPRCFNAEPELAVPFVAAISRAINGRQLRHLSPELMLLRQRVIEPTYDRVGGPSYIALRNSMEAAQARYFSQHYNRATSLPVELPAEVCELQRAFFATRQRHAAEVERVERGAARAYWKANPRHGIADDFFNDAANDSIPARMARVEAAWWWRSFFTRLQAKSQRHHAADGRLLDALPSLRAQAKKTTLAAQIARWSETAAADWGWRGGTHYRRLAEYADRKARSTVAWFDHRAPGYLGTPAIRCALDTRLHQFLTELDPHTRLLAAEWDSLSEHWRN